MSADNYAECPRCKVSRQELADEAQAEAMRAYGKASIEDFDAARAHAAELAAQVEQPYTEYTFREDYSISGASTGKVSVVYKGRCTVCKLLLEFRHEHEMKVSE